MRENFRVYRSMIRAAVLARLEYRADFLMGILGVFILNAGTLGTTWVLLSRFQELHGWTFWQIVFLYNLWLLGHGIRAIFFNHVSNLETFIVDGTFDQLLTRPANPFVQFIGREIHYLGVGDVLLALTMITISYQHLHLHWVWWMFGWFVVVAVSSAIVEMSLILFFSCTAFFTTRSGSILSVATQFNWGVVQQYPVDMFKKWLRVMVTLFLPFAFMNYYPALMMIGKQNQVPYGFLTWLSPFVAVCLLFIALTMWNFGISRYKSTGS